jgi:hypothetical protein
MDNNFQTSFIPKRPLAEERVDRPQSISIVSLLSTLVFISALVLAGGSYFYKSVTTQSVATNAKQFALAKNRFEPRLVTDLAVLNKRITSAQEILSSHVTVTPIFQALSDLTLRTIRYTKFTYAVGITNNARAIVVKMGGQADGYQSIALQSDVFKQNKYIQDPVFSNLNLDDKGRVTFDLTFTVDQSLVSFSEGLARQSMSPGQPTNQSGTLPQ